MPKKLTIVIPAHNEQDRIGKTLTEYCAYFDQKKDSLDTHFIVVLNGCTDNTAGVISTIAATHKNITALDIPAAGKGLALAHGFKKALTQPADYIGFVDADMATAPRYFDELFIKAQDSDGAIASRYMPGASIYPPRPWIKTWGRRLVYDSLVHLLFGMGYYDTQCGAKIFSRRAIEKIAPHLKVTQWGCDVELLYLCKRNGFAIKEIPTTWYDQHGSKLKLRSGMRMIGSLFKLRFRFLPLRKS